MELPLGCEFEDSVFAPSRARGASGGAGEPPYSAKRCEPRWFCGAARGAEDAAGLSARKFLGDLAFRERRFQAALCEYSSCLRLLPPGNVAVRRDVQEGCARCLSRLGRHQEALDIAEKLRTGATNADHLTSVLNLQVALYEGLGAAGRTIQCLQQLLCLHPFNPWYWKRLAEAYWGLGQSRAPLLPPERKLNPSGIRDSKFKAATGRGVSLQPLTSEGRGEWSWSSPAAGTETQNPGPCSNRPEMRDSCTSGHAEGRDEGKQGAAEPWEQDALKQLGIKACASFIRARLLLQLTQPQQASFVLERNTRSQEEIEDKVERFGLGTSCLQLMAQVMGADLLPENLREEPPGEARCVGPAALPALLPASAAEFEAKWFGNLPEGPCRLDTQFCSDIRSPPSVI